MPPFTIPPPLPPQDFSGLTEEELKAMEGHERANVEARIKCLRNIQVLLDAAVMEMQQYSSVVGQLDLTSRSMRPPPPPPVSSVATEAKTASSAATSTPSTSSKPLATAETGARAKVKSDDAIPSKSSEEEKDKVDDTNESTDEQNEVRKRRLERFGSNSQTPE